MESEETVYTRDMIFEIYKTDFQRVRRWAAMAKKRLYKASRNNFARSYQGMDIIQDIVAKISAVNPIWDKEKNLNIDLYMRNRIRNRVNDICKRENIVLAPSVIKLRRKGQPQSDEEVLSVISLIPRQLSPLMELEGEDLESWLVDSVITIEDAEAFFVYLLLMEGKGVEAICSATGLSRRNVETAISHLRTILRILLNTDYFAIYDYPNDLHKLYFIKR